MCGDLPAAEQKFVLATGAVPVPDLFNQQVPGTAWRTKPSWYIVANNDRTVNPDLQRAAAERIGARTYAVDSSHVPISRTPTSSSTSSATPRRPSRHRAADGAA